MKKMIVLLFIALLAVGLIACTAAGNVSGETKDKTPVVKDPVLEAGKTSIVVWFSCTGHTERIAGFVAESTGADRYEIVAKDPYSEEDLDYNNGSSRASVEQSDPTSRPEISGEEVDLSEYDIIYLGYPIWFGQAPKIMYTFVEAHDLAGKKVVPFCTSASSGIGSSATTLSHSAPDAVWSAGRRFSTADDKEAVREWLYSIG